MKVIILAAGIGSRLQHMTRYTPKCLVKVHGKPLLDQLVESYKKAGIQDIVLVTGFMKDKITVPGATVYVNDDFLNNNILVSLMYAEQEFTDSLFVTYADILYDEKTIKEMLAAPGDIVVGYKKEWMESYQERKDKPTGDAEKVAVNGAQVTNIGKYVSDDEAKGEFIGVIKFSKEGIQKIKRLYREFAQHGLDQPFRNSPSLKKAYLTDLLQEYLGRGNIINGVAITGTWVEVDTLEDLKRAGGQITSYRITPEHRRGMLKKHIAEKGFVRAIEAHNGMSGIIANTTMLPDKSSFDALWISSLTESAVKGQPDIEIMGFDSRLATVAEVMEVTNIPIIIDGDTGGDPNAFEYLVRKAEAMGASAVIIEDKVYPKRNSLDAESRQELADPKEFAAKIRRGKDAQLTEDFMVIARLESFIAGIGLKDALARAKIYLDAGVDGIMVHSKEKTPAEVFSFAKEYSSLFEGGVPRKPLVCVPTTYDGVTEEELKNHGFQVVIYANHMLRAAIKAMQEVGRSILEHQRAKEVSSNLAPVIEIFDLVGFSDIKAKERLLSAKR